MGKAWKRVVHRRRMEAAKAALAQPAEEKVAPAPKPEPVPEPVVEKKVEETPKPRKSYKAKKNSTAKKKVKK